VLAIIVGSVVQTEEWKTGKRIKAIIFIIAVAIGSLLTTKGWNEWGNYSQKRALIVGLAREWRLNDFYARGEPMSFDVNDPNLGQMHFMYPQFRTSTQDRILTSELFNPNDRKDRELLNVVVVYEGVIKDFNILLYWDNEACARFSKDVRQKERKKLYLEVREAPLHVLFKRSHTALLNLLEKEYNWALNETQQKLDINPRETGE
jgi:hypothetical protein